MHKMKFSLLYLLIYAYTSIIVKPLLPDISDFLAHTFNYSNHIATVHQHNGKYHVHSEHMEEQKKSGGEKSTHFFRDEVFSSEHLVTNNLYDFSIQDRKQIHFAIISPHICSSFLNKDIPPPKA